MTQKERLLAYVEAQYGVTAEYPWEDDDSCVLRRADSRKWFGVVMRIPATKLGFADTVPVEVINVKLDPILVGSLREVPGFHPAWHMNKTYWVTARLDDTVADDELKLFIDQSYGLAGRGKKRG